MSGLGKWMMGMWMAGATVGCALLWPEHGPRAFVAWLMLIAAGAILFPLMDYTFSG